MTTSPGALSHHTEAAFANAAWAQSSTTCTPWGLIFDT